MTGLPRPADPWSRKETPMKNGIQKTLPADFGATVWRADRKHLRVVPMKVHSYHLVGSRRDVVELVEERSDCEVHTRWKVLQFGKTLFTSEEAARAALSDHC